MIEAYGRSFWRDFREFVANGIAIYRRLDYNRIWDFLFSRYTFYGIGDNFLFKSAINTGSILVNYYDPELDDTDFCDDLGDFTTIDKEWIFGNSEDMHEQNSHNFKEFLKVLYNIKSRMYIPKFSFINSKVKRSTTAMFSEDGRISIQWNETTELESTDYRLYLLYLTALLLCFGVINYTVVNRIINIYFPDFIGVFDICNFVGKGVRIMIRGRFLKSLRKFLSSTDKIKKFSAWFIKQTKPYDPKMLPKAKDIPRLPPSKRLLKPRKWKALPKARDT
jgi:hypothetical protein